jgi:hypothetical protein
MSTDNALSFVGKIKTACKAAQKAEGDALKYAIECGEQLNLAKEKVLAAKGKWGKWREEHIPEISQQTASLYMRLAENVETAAKCTSIRGADLALRALNAPDDPKMKSDSDADDDETADDTNNALLVRKGASPDLKTILQNVAVDEVCSVLTQTWDADQLRDLVKRVNVYLATRPSDLAIPSALPRPLTPAQPSQG